MAYDWKIAICSAESSAALLTMAKIACVHPHLYDDFQRLSAFWTIA